MADKICNRLLVSWIFFVLAFYTYETAGLGYAFIPCAIAAMLRVEHDKQFGEKIRQWSRYQISALVYYAILLVAAVIEPKRLAELSGTMLTVVVALPLFVVVIVNDVSTCRSVFRPDK